MLDTERREIQTKLAKTFEELLAVYKDTPDTRLTIASYTVGYMGCSYGLRVDGAEAEWPDDRT